VIGGVGQGLGQALIEAVRYDEDGQVLTGSLMDYGLPRADMMPGEIAAAFHSVPSVTNAIGVKGVGEAGTTAAISAIMNAIADAIPNGRGDAIDMPATPEKVWRACNG
jgi:aerobic carbon-monoxide dehydrogenase large subunit